MLEVLLFTIWILVGFCGMEVISYLIHRFIFHGVLWKIHKTHHTPDHGLFEANDLFSVFFAAISIAMMYYGMSDPMGSAVFAMGLGIALYGVLYFIIHDLFAHKRFVPFKSDSKIMRLIRRAHRNHHQSIDKPGQEPYGLFLFPYDEYPPHKRKR